ncbi:MAG: AMP-binding protein, partial [Pseudomonadota bacterium]
MRANSVELQQQLQSLAERFASLDDKKKALFLEKLEAESISFDQLPIVARRGDAGDWPLSPPQEALWLAAQLHPEDTSYHLSFAIDITGSLDVERLSVAFDELLLKHPVLRLRFVEPSEDERNPGVSVCQQVVPFSARRLEVTETSQSGLYAALSEHAARSIHLGQGRPVSLALFRLGSERHVLSFVAHHLVFDNQSFLLLASELVAAYLRTDESVAGVDAAPGAVDFIDYCRWQRDWARSPAFATQSQHWGELFQDREALAQAQGESLFEPLVLPSDLAALRSEQVPVGGQRHRFAIDAEVCRGLESVCAQRNISFYTLLMSAFGLALSQAAGRRSFTLGTSVANRSRPEVASALGMFVNTLLLPITREDSLSAGQWLSQQHDTVSLALGAPDVPVESILRDAQKLTDTSFGQLCRVFFVLLDNSELMDTGVAAKGAVLKLLDPFENSDRGPDLHHDLCLRVFRDRQQGGCQCQLEFLPQSIDAQSVAGIETLLQRWLDTLSDPQALSLPLGELAARSVESQRMPELQTAGSTSESVIARIALQASEYPEAIALSDDAGDVTYRALLGEIHIIAEWYRRLGCDEGAIVLLQMPRHRMQVIHSLALLALGASYLPLEPDMPTQRLENLVALCGPLCRVIDGAPMDPRDALGNTVLPTYTAVTPQAVVEMYDLAIAGPQEPRLPHVSGDAVAYNIMTSGSSGTPKCVQVSHRAILAYVDAVMPALNLESDATLASLSSVAADLAYTAVFGALLTGRCLRLLAADVATDAAQLATIGQQRPVDCMKLVPTHLQALLRVTDGDAILPRQCLVLGGEALPIGLVREVRRRAPGLRIINHYGPTECCVGVSVQVVDDEQTTDSFQWSHLPIGTALPQATLFTCNRFGEPLPAGLAGELLIGGESLAAGYLDDAAATAAAFTEHAGQRCYRSGDRVKRLLNGQYLFLERQDRQVKIRGNRIELTEIEQQFLAADGVVDAFAT